MELDIIRTELTVLKLEAGDILVVRLPPLIEESKATAVHNAVKGALPPSVKIMTFRGEVGLDVIKAAPVDEADAEGTTRRRGRRGASDAQSQL